MEIHTKSAETDAVERYRSRLRTIPSYGGLAFRSATSLAARMNLKVSVKNRLTLGRLSH